MFENSKTEDRTDIFSMFQLGPYTVISNTENINFWF